MSLTLLVWLGMFATFSVLSLLRPVWGIVVYFLTFFASPPLWWWGGAVADYRWALYGGVILLLSVVLHGDLFRSDGSRLSRRLRWIAVAMVINATFVHFLLADDVFISSRHHTHVLKFSLLFILLPSAIKDRRDLRIVTITILLGLAYIGAEVTFNDRGAMVRGRLEGVGVPEGRSSNELASLMATLLPIAGTIYLTGNKWAKLVAILGTPLALNVLLLCNSRGGFLATIGSGIVFLVATPGATRKQALKLVALGSIAIFLLLGDPRIVQRFSTTFASKEERVGSAAVRLQYWTAGFEMMADYPLGAGGDHFSKVHGPRYLYVVTGDWYRARSVHNGYINDACEWGIQGLALHVAFLLGGGALAWRVSRNAYHDGDRELAISACAVLSGTAAFMIASVFGDYLDNEWGYWIVALSVACSKLRQDELSTVAQSKHIASSNSQATPVTC